MLSIVNFSKTRSLYRHGMSPVVRSALRPAWHRVPARSTFYYKSAKHDNRYVLSFTFVFDKVGAGREGERVVDKGLGQRLPLRAHFETCSCWPPFTPAPPTIPPIPPRRTTPMSLHTPSPSPTPPCNTSWDTWSLSAHPACGGSF